MAITLRLPLSHVNRIWMGDRSKPSPDKFKLAPNIAKWCTLYNYIYQIKDGKDFYQKRAYHTIVDIVIDDDRAALHFKLTWL